MCTDTVTTTKDKIGYNRSKQLTSLLLQHVLSKHECVIYLRYTSASNHCWVGIGFVHSIPGAEVANHGHTPYNMRNSTSTEQTCTCVHIPM